VDFRTRPRVLVREQYYRGERHRLKSGHARRDIPLSAGMADRLPSRASLLFDAGRSVKQLASWLGHADPAFTPRTYVHLMDEGLGDADFLDAAVARVNAGSTRGPQTTASDQGRERVLSAL
jgi:integrase